MHPPDPFGSNTWQVFLADCQSDLLYHSRVHPLQIFARPGTEIMVKREDESGFGTSGCKKRKIASIIPFLKRERIEQVGIIGGARSNHVVSLLQWVREAGLRPRLFLKERTSPSRGGNSLLLHLLSDPEEITWLNSSQWPQAEEIARKSLQKEAGKSYVVPEGGYCAPAVAGLATLLMDIERNEAEGIQRFDHICIDAGTGLSAAVLVWLNHLRQRSSQIEVILTAGDTNSFSNVMAQSKEWLRPYCTQTLEGKPSYRTHRPATAASFGSVNATIRQAVKRYAQTAGLLTDPVYTAKLFYTCEQLLQKGELGGKVLIIHSGGGTGLMGFQF